MINNANTILSLVVLFLLQGCALNDIWSTQRKQKIYSTGVLKWKDDVRIFQGKLKLSLCDKISSRTKFKRSKYNSPSDSYLEFLIFIKKKGANVALIESMDKESFFNRMSIKSSLYKCNQSALEKYLLSYVENIDEHDCEFIREVNGRYELPIFAARTRSFEKFSAHEAWAKLDLEKKALKIGANVLKIEDIDEAFWSGDITIKAKAYKCKSKR